MLSIGLVNRLSFLQVSNDIEEELYAEVENQKKNIVNYHEQLSISDHVNIL